MVPRLESAILSDLDDSFYYGLTCQSCQHSSRLSLTRLRSLLGDTFPLKDVRTRLKCSKCDSKLIVVTFLAPHQAVGNLALLFEQKPV